MCDGGGVRERRVCDEGGVRERGVCDEGGVTAKRRGSDGSVLMERRDRKKRVRRGRREGEGLGACAICSLFRSGGGSSRFLDFQCGGEGERSMVCRKEGVGECRRRRKSGRSECGS